MVLTRVMHSDYLRKRAALPEGRIPQGFRLELPGRGSTYVTDTAGPSGAPTVLLLHGAGCTGLLSWYPSIAALRRHFRVVTMDQRCHGEGIRTSRFSLYDCADDVASVVEELDLGKVLLMGHSMGSIVAQRVWRQHPEVVAGLVLCSTTDRFRGSPSESLFFGTMEASVAASRLMPPSAWAMPPSAWAAWRRARRTTVQASDEADATVAWIVSECRKSKPGGLAQAVAACGRHHSAPWLSQVDVPTAVVVTSRDRVIAPQRQRAIAERIPGATVHEVDAGHAACITAVDEFVPVAVEAAVLTASRAGYSTEFASAG